MVRPGRHDRESWRSSGAEAKVPVSCPRRRSPLRGAAAELLAGAIPGATAHVLAGEGYLSLIVDHAADHLAPFREPGGLGLLVDRVAGRRRT